MNEEPQDHSTVRIFYKRIKKLTTSHRPSQKVTKLGNSYKMKELEEISELY